MIDSYETPDTQVEDYREAERERKIEYRESIADIRSTPLTTHDRIRAKESLVRTQLAEEREQRRLQDLSVEELYLEARVNPMARFLYDELASKHGN